ncbi:hypothetical protein THAOC_06406 [Thalassiosira oceanica]|uniref:Uncharacterized protein n=1 Tax=Thalassiosira oceanica TaxID=159749 RepID=K0T0C9_THAOC|nr:hypothetical protein THAOC_06406 [Thalassiosira oceanica]|eukprot:EJK72098.1 hypothetical protein THAOC_06406 [Thalassiosira oceanica]
MWSDESRKERHPALMRDVPKTDAASARGASRGKTRGGGGASSRDPRRRSSPAPRDVHPPPPRHRLPAGRGRPCSLPLTALPGEAEGPLALRASLILPRRDTAVGLARSPSSSPSLRGTAPLALRARSAVTFLSVPPGDCATRPPGSLCRLCGASRGDPREEGRPGGPRGSATGGLGQLVLVLVLRTRSPAPPSPSSPNRFAATTRPPDSLSRAARGPDGRTTAVLVLRTGSPPRPGSTPPSDEERRQPAATTLVTL